jgi:hypothetical protein
VPGFLFVYLRLGSPHYPVIKFCEPVPIYARGHMLQLANINDKGGSMSKSLIAMIREAASPARATKQMTLELDALSARGATHLPPNPLWLARIGRPGESHRPNAPRNVPVLSRNNPGSSPDVPLHHTQCFPDRNPPVPIFPPGNSSPGKMAPAFIR